MLSPLLLELDLRFESASLICLDLDYPLLLSTWSELCLSSVEGPLLTEDVTFLPLSLIYAFDKTSCSLKSEDYISTDSVGTSEYIELCSLETLAWSNLTTCS